MALLNRFSKLNDRGETGIFTFIVTKSVTRDFHRDATTKDFCFGYHRWAISFQRPNEKVLGVHLLLRNPSPSTSCLVDFTLTLLNREHFSQNEVYTKKQAKFTITNPMQGVARWIQMSDLIDKHFSNETGEFLFELSLSNMTTIFECDIQLSPNILTQYKSMLKSPLNNNSATDNLSSTNQQLNSKGEITLTSNLRQSNSRQMPTANNNSNSNCNSSGNSSRKNSDQLINLETNYFTFGSFDWSLTIVPLVIPSQQQQQQHSNQQQENNSNTSSSSSSSNQNLLTPNKQLSNSSLSIASNSSANQPTNQNSSRKSVHKQHKQKQQQQQQQQHHSSVEPVCRIYLNRLNGFDCLCRVKYRVILGHHQPGSPHPAEFVDSRLLDQISDSGGRIRGHQFRNTNILKLISLRSGAAGGNQQQQQPAATTYTKQHHQQQNSASSSSSSSLATSLDLRVHIEMFCANTVSEAKVPMQRKPNETQVSNCSDRNKQAWCVESDSENENVRLKLFFMDLQSVPRNHIRYISWIAYIVRRDSKSGAVKESIAVQNSPHSNYYLQDGIDMGTLMDTEITTKELNNSPKAFLTDGNQLTVHIEWVDSLLLFSHLYNNYDSLATIQRHQIRRELSALQQEFELLERKYLLNRKALNQLLDSGAQLDSHTNNNNNNITSSTALATGTGSGQQQEQRRQSGTNLHCRKNSLLLGQQLSSSIIMAQAPAPAQAPNQTQATTNNNMEHSLHWSQGNLAASEGSGATSAVAASALALSQQMIIGQQQQQQFSVQLNRKTPPMSHDERLKFSSSTPPSRSALLHHHSAGTTIHQKQQQQLQLRHNNERSDIVISPTQHQLIDQLKSLSCGSTTIGGGCLTGSQSSRRRLPQQPVFSKLQAQEICSTSGNVSPIFAEMLTGSGVHIHGAEQLDSIYNSPVKQQLALDNNNNNNSVMISNHLNRTSRESSLTMAHHHHHHHHHNQGVISSFDNNNNNSSSIGQAVVLAANTVCAPTTQHHLLNQAEDEQVDRFDHGSMNALDLSPTTTTNSNHFIQPLHHQQRSASYMIPAQQAAGNSAASPFNSSARLYGGVDEQRLVMVGSALIGVDEQGGGNDNMDLHEMEMEALYVAAQVSDNEDEQQQQQQQQQLLAGFEEETRNRKLVKQQVAAANFVVTNSSTSSLVNDNIPFQEQHQFRHQYYENRL